jgi:hypothetical protein
MAQLDPGAVPVVAADRDGSTARRRARGVPPALALAISAVTAVAAALAATNLTPNIGPLFLTNGTREVVATTGVALNSVSGQVVAMAMPVSTGHGTIVLESAALLPLPGYPTPQLADLGVYRGPVQGPAATSNWPPRNTSSGNPPLYDGPLAVSAFTGTQIGPVQPSNGTADSYFIYFGISGQKSGVNYVTAGLRVVYRIGGTQYETNLYQMGEDCVRSSLQDSWDTDMNAFSTEFRLYGNAAD